MNNSLTRSQGRYELMKYWFICVVTLLILISGCDNNQPKSTIPTKVKTIDLFSYMEAPPNCSLNLLFIHHSCGGQWLADKGPPDCKDCICKTHPNGGGLRRLLQKNNYIVYEASYNSIIGDKTDIQNWPSKFKNHMDRILRTKIQDELLSPGEKNSIVMFKSCFPNNNFTSDEAVRQAQNAYRQLLPIFRKYPDVLFVAITAPPLVSPYNPKNLLKKLFGKWVPDRKSGKRARAFNNWLKDVQNGWLSHYPLKNVVVFDYYDVLTMHGKSNWAEYASSWTDSHPNSAGNKKAAELLVPFLNKAVRRAGLTH